MKKIISMLFITVFFFACEPKEDNGNNTSPNDTTEIVNNNTKSDTTEIVITPEQAEQKSEEILQKSEDINNQLDELLKN